MKKTLQVINDMVRDGIINDYAIGGSIGAMFYTEAINTKDLDIFVYPQVLTSGLVHLNHIYQYLGKKGYKMKGQFFIIDGVPVDFVIAGDELVDEAIKNYILKSYDHLRVRVMSPEYLIAIALKVRRPQDMRKADMLLMEAPLDRNLLNKILEKHNIKYD